MPSWDHPCGGSDCKKLRISPFGELAPCINLDLVDCRSLNEDDLAKKMLELKEKKMKLDVSGIPRKHYSPDIGKVRFGEVSSPINYSFFQNINKRRIKLEDK